jgi:hypothetical protein
LCAAHIRQSLPGPGGFFMPVCFSDRGWRRVCMVVKKD